jgi:preprotein translocase subunit SecA
MPSVSERFVRTWELLSLRSLARLLDDVEDRLRELKRCSDEEVAGRCRDMLDSPRLSVAPEHPLFALTREIGEADSHALALAAEAFRRFPPTRLSAGTSLYRQQLTTALHLMRGSLVQMDTGEGKTFAIAAAAFALLRIHPRVYVVTANPYLAIRDAARTAPYWEGCGASVGRALPSSFNATVDSDWEADVVYTTLDALVFRSLEEDEGDTTSTLVWSAVLLDEADEILLEQAPQVRRITRYSSPSIKDWSPPLEIAGTLEEADVSVDQITIPFTNLTHSGEQKVEQLAGSLAENVVDRLQLMHDVELAYTALRLVREGHHFDVKDGVIVTINPTTGFHTLGVHHPWVGPLARLRGLREEPRLTVLHTSDGMSVLRRFGHVAGTSGTIVDEAIEYLMLLSLPPALVRPRTPRRNGLEEDLMASSESAAHAWVVKQVQAEGAKRPMLIVTDATPEAVALAARIEGAKVAGVTVSAVSGETIAEQEVFETAGQSGVTIVSTRAAGRGVDIALTPEARARGGAILISMGHAIEPRLDRQLLGRVGRQGDPYNARFVFHPETALIRTMGTNRQLGAIADKLMQADDPISAGMLTRQIRKGQRRIRIARLGTFAGMVTSGLAEREVYETLRSWRRELLSGPPAQVGALSDSFIAFLAERHVSTRYPGLEFERGGFEPDTAAREIAELVGRPEDVDRLSVETTGQPPAKAKALFVGYLEGQLADAQAANERARSEIRRRLAEGEASLLDSCALQTMLNLARLSSVPEPVTVGAALEAALRGSAPGPSPRVATETAMSRTLAVRTWMVGETATKEAAEDKLRAGGTAVLVHALRDRIRSAGRSDPSGEALLVSTESAIDANRSQCADLDRAWAAQAERSPAAIASETLSGATDRVATSLASTRFHVAQAVPETRYYTAYASAVAQLRNELEMQIAADMCTQLVAGRDPAELDRLFQGREHSIAVNSPKMDVVLPVLPAQKLRKPRAAPTSVDDPKLVVDYYRALEQRQPRSVPSKELLFPALNWFQGRTLGDPDEVRESFNAWKRESAGRRRLAPWRRRTLDRHVREYLLMLNQHGLAAPLPTGPAELSRSVLRRTRAAVSNRGPALGFLALLGALVGAGVLALLSNSRGVPVSPAASLVERFFSVGLLSAGSALALVLLGVLSVTWLRCALGVSLARNAGVGPGEHALSTLVVLAAALTLLRPWHGSLGFHTLWTVVGCSALVAAAALVRNLLWQSEQFTQAKFSAGLAAACAAFGAIPFLADRSGSDRVAGIVACAVVVLMASSPFRRAVIPSIAMRIDTRRGENEQLAVPLAIRAPLSVSAHLYALLVAWLVSCVIVGGSAIAMSVAAAVSYLAVLAFAARTIAAGAADPERWYKRMRRNDQAFSADDRGDTLETALAASRKRVVALELAAVTPIVAFTAVVATRMPAGVLREIPVGQATIFATVAALDLGRLFVQSLASTMRGVAAAPPSFETPEEGIFAEGLQESVRHIWRRLAWVAVALVVISKLSDLLGIITFLEAAWSWITGH